MEKTGTCEIAPCKKAMLATMVGNDGDWNKDYAIEYCLGDVQAVS